MIETRPVTPERLDDLALLFGSDKTAEKCSCMWYVISVKEFHDGGAEQNRARFAQLAATEDAPMGVLAYVDGEPRGWCAAGPRERYARAIKTPTYRSKTEDPLTDVWLTPCLYVHPDARGTGMTAALLEAAVQLATDHGAEAVDGFPYTNAKRSLSAKTHVGFESTFADCGFEPLRTPSESRVVVRRRL